MGTDYISVLVLGLFNAIVNQDSIRGEFKPELGVSNLPHNHSIDVAEIFRQISSLPVLSVSLLGSWLNFLLQ